MEAGNLILPRYNCSYFNIAAGLWNCQSAAEEAEEAEESQRSLVFKTWITPDNSATSTDLSSAFPLPLVMVSLLIHALSQISKSFFKFPCCSTYQFLPYGNLHIDVFHSVLPEDGAPLILLDGFNFTPEKLRLFLELLPPLILPPRAENTLDLIFTRSGCTSRLTVTHLPASEHLFFTFSSCISSSTHPLGSPQLCFPHSPQLSDEEASTSPSSLLSSLPRPLTTKPARASPLAPWLSECLRTQRTEFQAAERNWKKKSHHFKELLASYHLPSAVSAKTTLLPTNPVNLSLYSPSVFLIN